MAGGLGARRLAALVACTAVLGAVLFGVDRLVMGPVPPRGWQRAPRLAALPAAITRPPAPPYLPPGSSWPPDEVRYRLTPRGEDDGLWLGLRSTPASGVTLWIGRGARDASAVLGGAAGCLSARCPAGWRSATVRVPRGPRLTVIGRVAARELERVVSALSLAHTR